MSSAEEEFRQVGGEGEGGSRKARYLDDGPPPGWSDYEAMKRPLGGEGLVPLKANDHLLETVLSEGRWLIMFGSQSCLHCHRTLPTLERLKLNLEDEEGMDDFRIGVVDCESSASMRGCYQWGANKFPALFLVQDGGNKITGYPMNRLRARAELLDFMAGGWEQVGSVPWLYGPLGPMARWRLYTFDTVDIMMNQYQRDVASGVSQGKATLDVAVKLFVPLGGAVLFLYVLRKVMQLLWRKAFGSRSSKKEASDAGKSD